MTYYADNLLKRKLKEKKIIKQMQEKFIKSACADSIRVDMVTIISQNQSVQNYRLPD